MKGLSTLERFMNKVQFSDNGCWEWTAAKQATGLPYGWFCFQGKMRRAHRIAWILYKDAIPDNLEVLHRCDNASCVNPDHLFLGTQDDNVKDMFQKGRARRQGRPGEKHHGAKLTWEQVRQIRTLLSTKTQNELAQMYGVKRSTIGLIKKGVNWKE